MAFRFVVFCAAALLLQNASGAIQSSPQFINGLPSSTSTFADVQAYASSAGSSIIANGYESSVGGSGAASSSIASSYGNGLALPAGNIALNNGLAGIASGYGNGLAPANLAGYGPGIASGYGNAVALGNGLAPYGFSNNLINTCNPVFVEQPNYFLAQQPAVLSVFSGSPVYDFPCGITVSSENEMSGAVSVAGTLPFCGSSWFDGSVPADGAAAVSYATGSGAALYNAGCGVGLGGSNGVVVQGTQQYFGNPSVVNCI